jgi:hypothetical protein
MVMDITFAFPDKNHATVDDCTVRDEWFFKRSSELRAKMIMIEMSEVQEEQLEEKIFMLAQGS